jgi:hypothetical protein
MVDYEADGRTMGSSPVFARPLTEALSATPVGTRGLPVRRLRLPRSDAAVPLARSRGTLRFCGTAPSARLGFLVSEGRITFGSRYRTKPPSCDV